MRYVVIGGGVAGVTAAKTIRAHDPAADIKIYAEEYHPLGLYARKDLARRLSDELGTPESYLVESKETLEGQGIQFIQQAIPRLYTDQNQIFVVHSYRANYDKLLLAVGAAPKLVEAPGHALLGVHQIRTYDDATLLEDWLPDLQAHGAVVIGGGILGLDMAYALQKRGIPVTLIVREAHVGAPLLSEATASLIEARLRNDGITLITGQEVKAFLSDDGKLLDAVELDDETVIRTRLALCCIGVRPVSDFLEDTGIGVDEVTGGILVNEYMQTSVPNVYAAGSCAQISDTRSRNWNTAAEQGRIAALNMLGIATPYQPALVGDLNTRLYDLPFAYFDRFMPTDGESAVWTWENATSTAQIAIREGQIISARLLGDFVSAGDALWSLAEADETVTREEAETMFAGQAVMG